MSNPAIVMMTDPSRCSLGDVHYLVQALLEMQQMGQHATPQAFCDHPAAAKDFIAAYTHAYPQLVLEDREIPTPDHLHSLITTGQVGGIARPFDAAAPDNAGFASQGFAGQAFGGAPRPAEQNGMAAFPIVVLTLGSSQALADALQQSAGMKDSVRLIDIVPEGAEKTPLSIADAAVIGDGLLKHEEPGGLRTELDEMSGASATDSATLALHDDQLNLNVVEPDDMSGSALPVDDQEEEQEPAPIQPASAAAQPEPAAVVAQPAEPVLSDESYGGGAAAEQAIETTSQAPAWPGAAAPVVPVEQPPAEDLAVDDPAAPNGDGDGQAGDDQQGGEPQKGAGKDGSADPPDADEPEPDEEKAKAGVLEPDDDLVYPPVGTLTAEADVHYPALEQVQGALHELAAVMLEDGMIDADGMDAPTADRPDAVERMSTREGEANGGSHLVAIEDLQEALDGDSDDPLDEATIAWPQHDSDL